MKRLILVAGLLAAAACVPATTYDPGYGGTTPNGYPVHPDPLCFYGEPDYPGGPYSEACA